MEATVMSVEARVLLWLNGPASEADDQLWFLSSAFSVVHEVLPPRFQRLAATTLRSTVLPSPRELDSSAVDRQLSIALVRLLPAIAGELRSRVWTSTGVKTDEHVQLWWMTERMALSWLASDDMFRWIAVDKASAYTSLLSTLDTLLASAPPDLSLAEVNLVLRTVRDATRSIPSLTGNHESTVYRSVLQLLASSWSVAYSNQDSKTQTTIVHQIADWVYGHDSSHSHTKEKASTTRYCDWDDDECGDKEEDPSSDKRTVIRPSSSLVDTDSSLEAALTTTWSDQLLSSFRSTVQTTLAVNGESSTSLRHLASQLRICS
ncbi:hypothetical protein PINS_up011383 [Pythium insidiosum]|nr:hypothetical protein PINS_up011383 [Pythium insidiosum]